MLYFHYYQEGNIKNVLERKTCAFFLSIEQVISQKNLRIRAFLIIEWQLIALRKRTKTFCQLGSALQPYLYSNYFASVLSSIRARKYCHVTDAIYPKPNCHCFNLFSYLIKKLKGSIQGSGKATSQQTKLRVSDSYSKSSLSQTMGKQKMRILLSEQLFDGYLHKIYFNFLNQKQMKSIYGKYQNTNINFHIL